MLELTVANNARQMQRDYARFEQGTSPCLHSALSCSKRIVVTASSPTPGASNATGGSVELGMLQRDFTRFKDESQLYRRQQFENLKKLHNNEKKNLKILELRLEKKFKVAISQMVCGATVMCCVE